MGNKEAHELLIGWTEFIKEFLEESDRSAVILACSLFDDVLQKLLKAYFVEGKIADSLVIGGSAPLATFSSKMKCAYSTGLLTKTEYGDLNKLRMIRDMIAHDWSGTSLEDTSIAQICRSLSYIGRI